MNFVRVLGGVVCANDGYPRPDMGRVYWPNRRQDHLHMITAPVHSYIIRSFGHKNHSSFAYDVEVQNERSAYNILKYDVAIATVYLRVKSVIDVAAI